VRANFASSIDSVNSGDGLKKTVLATTSKKTKIKTAPGFVALKEGRDRPNVAEYNHKNVPVAMLVEGKFRSAFAGRLPIALTTDHQFDHKDYSPDTKQIFISDGDMIRNFVDSAAWFPAVMMYQNPNVQRQFKMHEWLLVQKAIFPTGYDQNTGKMYDNTEFLVNCVDYLCDNSDMIELRSKILQIGQLDKSKTGVEKVKLRYQLLNLGLPLLLLVLTGAIAMVVRRFRYSRAR
jgi:gliding-associated putative ABC transporter substrate-binding component GldG